jgi:acetoacetyl-CoA synthetase
MTETGKPIAAHGPGPARRERGRLMREVRPEDWRDSRMGLFAMAAAHRTGRAFRSYQALWTWSIEEPDEFWASVIDFFGLGFDRVPGQIVRGAMPIPTWMPGARVNYAREALRFRGAEPALIGLSQTRGDMVLSRDELAAQVAACRAGLSRLGVGEGDRVAVFMPNLPETVVALLATASLGAVFASCPLEFGPRAVIDRLGQLEPCVLIASDGYVYGRRTVDRTDVVAEIVAALPSLRAVVHHDHAGLSRRAGGLEQLTWPELLSSPADLDFAGVEFGHPLYVLFSSGSTGRPKAIVHGHGGIVLEHAKALGLHDDVRPGDRFFWYATTAWMVWNYGVSALLHGAAMVCFDGDPAYPDGLELWRIADRAGATFFGTSATHIVMSARQHLKPAAELPFASLRSIGSTGSPLPPEGFEWLAAHVSGTARLSSVSGGTDVCSGFVGGSPLVPTRAGELSGPMLGCHAVALDDDGRPVLGEFGELCILNPMPSMPVAFLGDPDGARYRDAYFAKYPRVWAHGDWAQFFPDGGCVVSGRSDATLNRGGVRLGTAEIYAVLDALAVAEDSLVVHLEDPAGGSGSLLLLLAAPGADDEQRAAAEASIRHQLRQQLSPRHVPDQVVWVRRLPRTLTGKRLEKPVKQLLLGAEPSAVASPESLTDPAAFKDLAIWSQSSPPPPSDGRPGKRYQHVC